VEHDLSLYVTSIKFGQTLRLRNDTAFQSSNGHTGNTDTQMSVSEGSLQLLLIPQELVMLLHKKRNTCTSVCQALWHSFKACLCRTLRAECKRLSKPFNSPTRDLKTLGPVL